MSNYTYYVLLVLLFLAIAIYNMYRLKKKRDELRYYYDKKEKHRKIKIGSSHQMKKIIGEPGGGREYDFTNFPKSKEEVEEIAEKSISENPFSDKIKCLTKHYFTRLLLFNELILRRVGGHHVGHVRQGGVPVHVGLSFAQPVKVRAVYHHDMHRILPLIFRKSAGRQPQVRLWWRR